MGKLLQEVQPHDILKFGIIPELVGRLPVIAPLDSPEPGGPGPDPHRAQKRPGASSIRSCWSYDDVELVFEQDALEAMADKAIERNIGARGLRAVMEGLLTQIMYDIPSDPTIDKVTITRRVRGGNRRARADRGIRTKINYAAKLQHPARASSRSPDSLPALGILSMRGREAPATPLFVIAGRACRLFCRERKLIAMEPDHL